MKENRSIVNGLLGLVLVLLLAAVPGCKPMDTNPPSVTISVPTDRSSFRAGEEILVVGVASDDEEVVSIGVVLQDPLNNQVMGSATAQPDNQGRFSAEIVLGDRYTHSGDFILRATAYDQAGNPSSDFVTIYIEETPTVLYKTIFSAMSGAQMRLFVVDSFNQILPGPFVGNDNAVLYVDNRAQQVIYGSSEGPLVVVEGSQFDPAYELFLPSGPAPSELTAFAAFERNYFVGNTNPPFIQSYNYDGSPRVNFSDILFAPAAMLGDEAGLFVGMATSLTTFKLDRYNLETGALELSRNFSWLPEYIVSVNDGHIAVAGTDANGTGKFAVLDKSGLSVVDEYSLPEAVRDLDSHNEQAIVLTTAGLQVYDFPYRSLTNSEFVGASAMAWEPVSASIFFGEAGNIKIRTLGAGQIGQIAGSFGPPRQIRHHHNK